MVFETFHVVSCGQHGTKRCFMWFRVASVVLEMFHIVSCSQRGISRYFTRFRVASVVLEMCHVARGVVWQSGI